MKDLIVCRCEGVMLSDIRKSIEEGATSIPGVKKRVRVGMGPCQGRICQQIVKEILKTEANLQESIHVQRAQSPVRPTLLKDM